MDKTYVFDNNDGGCGGNGMMGLIASLCQNRGLDPNLVAALMNNNRGCGDGFGNSAWWIIILLIFGWGGFGNGVGGGFGGRGSAQGLADLGNLVNNDAGRDLIMQAIQGNATAISQLASTVHCDQNALMGAIQNLSTQLCNLGLGQKDLLFAVQNGQQAILSKLCDCCCDFRLQIADFRGDIALQMCNQTNTLQNAINFANSSVERGFAAEAYERQAQTCALTNAINAQTIAMNAGFSAIKEREDAREIQNLRDQVAQYRDSALAQQTATNVVQRINPAPIPAYWVPNVNGCGCNNYGYPFNGYNNGGCCNNNNCGGCGCC